MNRKMLMLSAFLSTSLLVTNSLQLVSCKKKGQKINDKNDNEKTAEQVEMETAVKLKTAIRNTIDEIVANPTANVWIINLIDEFADQYINIKTSFNKAIEDTKKEGKKKIDLAQVSNLDVALIEAVKLKFVNIREKIIEQINTKASELGVSNFNLDFDPESILPMLTTLTGTQVIKAVNRLKGLKNSNKASYLFISDVSNDLTKDVDEILNIELFKVTTDLKYNFSFGNKQYTDDYNSCELFLTENSEDFKKLNHFTQKTVEDLIKKDEDMKKLQIYQGDYNFQENAPINKTVEYIQNFEYIGKKMDWDFSKQEVKDEIKQMQYDNIKKSGKLRSIIDDLQFEISNFEFEPSNYVNFSNFDLPMMQRIEICVLVCNDKILKRNDVLQNIEKQYGLDENGTLKTSWDGSKINTKFIEQLKKDGEGENKIIDYSQYYGLGKNVNKNSDFLVGYGKTKIRKVYYAYIPIGVLDFTTVLNIPYGAAGMLDLYKDFKDYVGTIIDAIWNEFAEGSEKSNGIKATHFVDITNSIRCIYFLVWLFDNSGEWEAIEEKLANNNGRLSFDWIMEEVLLKKRILTNKRYKLPKNNAILDEAKTLLKIAHGGMCEKHSQINGLISLPTGEYKNMYIKYGPFVISITGNEEWADYWFADDVIITPNWD